MVTSPNLLRFNQGSDRVACYQSALFVLAMQPLACEIKHDTGIQGPPVPGSNGKEAKMSLYMDDFTILCAGNNSAIKALQCSDHFSQASAPNNNISKETSGTSLLLKGEGCTRVGSET